MIEVFKLLTGSEKIDYKQFFTLAQNHYSLRGHGMKLIEEKSRLDITKFYFSKRVVNGWNTLPATVMNVETVSAFNNAFDRNYVQELSSS